MGQLIMPVNSTHPEYNYICQRWNLVRSIVNNDAQKWIRTVDPADLKRSAQYKQDAILTNFTRLTKIGLTGLVFRKPAKIEVPIQLDYLIDDATGYNFGLEQLAQQDVGEILVTGRTGILLDCPNDEDKDRLVRFKSYVGESIVNWKYREVGSEYRLSLIVLKECNDDLGDDGFEWVQKIQYRVLMLDQDNVYHQVIYNEDGELLSGVTPLDYNGNVFNSIPFVFIGSENNDAGIDSIPLYDLAIVNLGHYRNSADVEETSYISGQAVPVIQLGETNAEEFEASNPGGINIGSRRGVVLATGGDFKFAQVQPNLLPRELMKDKEAQAASIGARLIAPPGGRETAEAARIRFGSQNSALYTITKNISLAYEQCLWWAAIFMMEAPVESVFELNDQFYEEDADPNLIAQEMMLFDRQIMSADEIRMNLGKSGIMLGDVAPDPIDPLLNVDGNEPA